MSREFLLFACVLWLGLGYVLWPEPMRALHRQTIEKHLVEGNSWGCFRDSTLFFMLTQGPFGVCVYWYVRTMVRVGLMIRGRVDQGGE